MKPSFRKKNRYFLDQFSQKYIKNYVLFSKKNFGSTSYQKNKSYLNELYDRSPYSKGYEDFSIIRCHDLPEKIVGCLHRLKAKLVHSSSCDTREVTALHNLMIDRGHYGCGYMLLSDALIRDPIFFVPGVIGELDNFYKKFAHSKIHATWFRRLILSNPLNTLKRFLRIPISKVLIKKYRENLQLKNLDLLIESDSMFDNLIKKDFDAIDGYRVTESFLKWRVFSNDINKVTRFVIHDGDGFISFAFGIRKNVPICRIIYSSIFSQQTSDILISEVCMLSKKLGFPLILNASDCCFIKQSCIKKNFKKIKNAPKIYFCSKSKDNVHTKHWGLLGDYGFDEFSFKK